MLFAYALDKIVELNKRPDITSENYAECDDHVSFIVWDSNFSRYNLSCKFITIEIWSVYAQNTVEELSWSYYFLALVALLSNGHLYFR